MLVARSETFGASRIVAVGHETIVRVMLVLPVLALAFVLCTIALPAHAVLFPVMAFAFPAIEFMPLRFAPVMRVRVPAARYETPAAVDEEPALTDPDEAGAFAQPGAAHPEVFFVFVVPGPVARAPDPARTEFGQDFVTHGWGWVEQIDADAWQAHADVDVNGRLARR